MTDQKRVDPPPESKFRIDFIDPLFAVAIHIGIVEGLMGEAWLQDRRIPMHFDEYADLLMFSAGFWLLALSWVGYHASIQRRAILSDARFILDIILLILYMFLLVYFREPKIFSVLLLFIFIIYVIWDFYKTKEHKEEYYGPSTPTFLAYTTQCISGWLFPTSVSKLRGEVVTVSWTIVSAVLVPFAFLPSAAESSGKLTFALVVIGVVTRYRFDKKPSAVWVWSLPFKILLASSVAFIALYNTRLLCV
jgi:hypothetical protein